MAVILITLYICAVIGKADVNMFLVCVIVVLSALIPLSVFTYAGKLRNKTTYVATNRRLIVYSGDLKAVDYELIKEAAFKQDADGQTTFLCGKAAIQAKPTKWRIISLFGLNDLEAKDGPVCECFAFYAL